MKHCNIHILSITCLLLFLLPKKVDADRCINVPDNQADLKQMMFDNIIGVRYGSFAPPLSANPSNNATMTDVDDYVNTRNQPYEQDPNVPILRTVAPGFNSSLRIGKMTYDASGSVVEAVADMTIDAKHPIINLHIAAVLVKGSSLSPYQRGLHSIKISFLGENDYIIDENCYSIALPSWQSAWQQYGTTNNYYIEWQSISIDFSKLNHSDIKKIRIVPL